MARFSEAVRQLIAERLVRGEESLATIWQQVTEQLVSMAMDRTAVGFSGS